MNVLIVDDSPAMRSFIRRILQLSGLPVDSCATANNGCEALAVMAQQKFDLVLTDINMPEMDGAQLLENMRHREDLNSLPVLVISTDSTHSRVASMLSLGAKGYIKKPFSPEVLREEIERVLESVQ